MLRMLLFIGIYAPILPVRLVNGSNPHTGRVEIYTNSTGGLDNAQWGTICDDEWDFLDARVVCRQLGYPDAVTALGSAQYGEGTVPVLLDNVNCVGDELNLITCGHNEIGIHDCEHSKDAAVECWGTYVLSYKKECTYVINVCFLQFQHFAHQYDLSVVSVKMKEE